MELTLEQLQLFDEIEKNVVKRNSLWNEAHEVMANRVKYPYTDTSKPYYSFEEKQVFTALQKLHFALKGSLEKLIADRILFVVQDEKLSAEIIGKGLQINQVVKKEVYGNWGIDWWDFCKCELWINRQMVACQIPKTTIFNELAKQWEALSQSPEENIDQLSQLSEQITQLAEEIKKEQKSLIADWSIILGADQVEKYGIPQIGLINS